MVLIDIAEIARRSGVPASTLRFYEERGLIESLGRRGWRRTFDPDVLERLSLMALGRSTGFSLDEISGMLGKRRAPNIDRSMLLARADEIDRLVRRLGALRDGLRHAAACPAPSHAECATFRRMMKVAANRTRKAKRKA
ncbi:MULTISPECIES: helix-turn-helix domain-containing protein [unclassified Sphingobium]|uniref:helix-turn-helix domain-containing protein n=1 Tax=unclassified Sphingobium TaxID=2611147 RepID=UPI0022254FEC|nr:MULTISPECIES: helix-turn-helix domain-containing protein [unclassified Sphingobium]MCW2395917.1 DNA-binding transcriptional MerR regulator [Sphingobium sp. B8D3B]MCW2419433.1 DNA-binding transcriptional MerR regulator [Sphingobium sp. B8D3C]